jgi:hypothetical protein
MKLPIPFLQTTKKDSKIYYLALLLTQEKVSAVILEEVSGKIKIVKRHNQLFHKNIDDLTLEELTEVIDKAVSRSEETLPPDVDIRKTVFGVKKDWVEDETKKIKKDYLQKLKKVCDSLDLSPIGFMVVAEAISHLIQEEEGAPLSAIFVELGRKMVTLTLFRGGKIVQTLPGALVGSYAQTVDELLKQFTIEVFPARIILYDQEIDEDIVQQFIGHHWSKSLPFLHMPQISVLPDGFGGRAVAFGAASQLGFEVLDVNTASEIKTYNPTETAVKEKKHHFGFIHDQDIAEQKHAHHEEKHPEVNPEPEHKTSHPIVSDSLIEPFQPDIPKSARKRGSFLKTFFDSLPKIGPVKFPSFGSKGILFPIICVFLFLALIIGGVYYFYSNNVLANFIVTLTPKSEAQSQNVVFTARETNDFGNNIVAAKKVDGSLDGDLTIGATGKKDTGEKAKGKVTIYNNSTDGDVTLSAGSSIKSENGLSFTLDKEIKVASASGDVFSGTKPGTTDVDITASDIGTNYNLPSGTKFSVESNNSLAAKNDDAFSGGTKKTVTVVSKDDLAKIKTDLVKKLEEKANDELNKQTQSDAVILPIVLVADVKATKYNKSAGDESKTVKLTASVNFTGLSYKKSDLEEFAKSILTKKYSKDMTFDKNAIEASVKDAKKESDTEISADVVIGASLLPKIETDRLEKQLSGKSVKDAEEILSRLPQVDKTTIVYKPNISILGKLFPRLPNHVTVTLSSQ